MDALILPATDLRAYVPRAGCVCHGLNALWCMVLTRPTNASDWDMKGSALVVQQPSVSSAWTELFSDVSTYVQLYLNRGAHWSLQKYFVPYPAATGDPLEVWLVMADYRLNLDSFSGSPLPTGGRFFIVRLTRTGVGNAWVATTGSGPGTNHVMFDISTLTATSGYLDSRHAHAGAIVPYTTESEGAGIRFVGSLGDDPEKNRFVTATLDDLTADYTVLSNWAFSDQYHGRSKVDGSSSDDGSYNPQSVGILQARKYLSKEDPEALIIGADNTSESISLIRCPSSGKPSIEFVHGVDTGFFNVPAQYFNNTFQFQTVAPERGTPIVALSNEENLGSYDGARYWYQPGAAEPSLLGLWASCMVIHTIPSTGSTDPGSYTSNLWAAPFDNYIVVSGYGTADLLYREKPAFLAMSPLVLSPGGLNMIRAGFLFDPASGDHTFTALDWDITGGWYDMDGSTKVYLSPQPASKCDQVFKVKTTQSADNLLATLRIATASTSSNNQTGWASASGVRQFRFLTLDDSWNPHWGLPRPTTSTISMALRDDASTAQRTDSAARVSNHTAWRPHTLTYDNFSMSSGPRIVLRIARSYNPTPYDRPCNESYFYLAADTAKDGEGSLQYPIAPSGGFPWPSTFDEHMDIDGFDLEHSFTLLMAGMMADNDWQHRTPKTGNYWPLFTLWGDADNWIEFGAYAAMVSGQPVGGFKINYKAGGTPGSFDWPRNNDITPVFNQYWSRNSQLLVGLSWDSTTHVLKVLASLAGDEPRSVGPLTTLPTPVFTHSFGKLKLRGAGDEVNTFLWFGGEAKDSALSTNDMADQFKTLEFLT